VLNEAVIGHYYRFMRKAEDGLVEPDVSIEEDLSEREGLAAEHVRRLVEPGGRLDPDEQRQFAEFIHLSRKRTPLARAWDAYSNEVMSAQWRDVYGAEPTGLPDTPDELALRMMYMAMEHTATHLTAAFTWTLLRAPAGRDFVIGDTPVAIIDPTLDPRLGLGFATSPNTETTFPLDPSLCLHLKPGGEAWLEREASAAEVDDVNLRAYAWAQHSIYGRSQAAVTAVRAVAKSSRPTVIRYAPRAGKMWFGEEAEGQPIWEGFSPTEAGVKPRIRR
jgi:hypothetical protein